MADLLTHVLVPFVLLTIAGWRIEFDDRWIPVAMGGAAIPDLVKIRLVVDPTVLEALLGTEVATSPISTLGGVVVIAGATTLAFGREYRRRAYAFLLFGGLSALVLDGLRVFADGRANYWLYPLWWRPPTPGLYVTSDPRVLTVALGVTALTIGLDRYVYADET